jgi:hypothetical protein
MASITYHHEASRLWSKFHPRDATRSLCCAVGPWQCYGSRVKEVHSKQAQAPVSLRLICGFTQRSLPPPSSPMMALFDKFALRRGVGLTNNRTCPAGFYSKLSYKGREDCQFCAPIPDRHEICTGRYVSTELRQGRVFGP